jgi:hypothetical protein
MFSKFLLLLALLSFKAMAMNISIKNNTDENIMAKINYQTGLCTSDSLKLAIGELRNFNSGNCCVKDINIFKENSDSDDGLKVDLNAKSNCPILKIVINVTKENDKFVFTKEISAERMP